MSTLAVRIDHRNADGFTLQIETQIPLVGVTALFGPSGSGKTTILDCVAGLRPDIGTAGIAFDAQHWQSSAEQVPAWKRSVGYVFQDARLFPHMSVAQNLDFAAAHAVGDSMNRDQIVNWLGIETLLQRRPETLSAGQQQRVAIARALARNPRLLLLDEPLANLDRQAAQQVLDCLRQISRESALPMLYVSHQIEEVCAIADQILLIENGTLQAQGSLLELTSRLDTGLAEDESAAALLEVTVGERDTDYALTELRIEGQSLWVATQSAMGSRQRLRVPARDVSVCREHPQGSSILNILAVRLVDIRHLSEAHCLLRLQLGEQFLLARITRRSLDELALTNGDALFAQIKSTALLGESA
jgi:molybdate transport system ATP-binding protein